MIDVHLTGQMTLGEAAVAAGTFALAAFTAWLGTETRATARAAREAVEASEEPFVIAVPTPIEVLDQHPNEEGGEPYLGSLHRWLWEGKPVVRLRLWNIGSGPGVVENVTLTRDEYDLLDRLPGFRPIGAGQAADLMILSPRWPVNLGDGTLTITYTRANGARYFTRSEVSVGDPTVTVQTYARTRLDD